MKKRLLHRGQSSGRVDDNEETIKQRLVTFHQTTKPVIDYYQKQNKVKRIDSERAPDIVFKDVEAILDNF
jgi:adenylate kinase family enzyme